MRHAVTAKFQHAFAAALAAVSFLAGCTTASTDSTDDTSTATAKQTTCGTFASQSLTNTSFGILASSNEGDAPWTQWVVFPQYAHSTSGQWPLRVTMIEVHQEPADAVENPVVAQKCSLQMMFFGYPVGQCHATVKLDRGYDMSGDLWSKSGEIEILSVADGVMRGVIRNATFNSTFTDECVTLAELAFEAKVPRGAMP